MRLVIFRCVSGCVIFWSPRGSFVVLCFTRIGKGQSKSTYVDKRSNQPRKARININPGIISLDNMDNVWSTPHRVRRHMQNSEATKPKLQNQMRKGSRP